MALVNVNVTDYIDEIETADLIAELRERVKKPKDTIKIIKEILGLREHHGKSKIIEELVDLMKFL